MSENLPQTTTSNLPITAGFGNADSFELLQRQAKLLASSELVPKEFQGKIANCVIALEMANRIGASPMAVLQNIYIVHGKPSWSSQFIIAAVNATGRFSPLRFEITGKDDKKTCVAWAIEKDTDERLESPPVSIEMAKTEGWFSRNGSKWKTMPDLMLRYRAATFFGRLYAPQILMGMRSDDEIRDIIDITPEVEPTPTAENIVKRFSDAETVNPAAGEIPITPEEKTEAAQTAPLPNMDDIDDDWPSPPGEAVKPCTECGEVGGHAMSCPNAEPQEGE
ncbi:MAG: hypothetical protein LHW45_10650 [Candidatus Cloacimonetes bacterium]|nr:hypothetical protein [Candidatus Cloacimonadota bacterium]MDY0368068.1 hypothetical protein [Candidatus Syntrophosphaera sp.]